MDGKEKCKALKQIRKQIAENNDIKYVVEECKHKGKCKGTCPKCEAEVRYLERELEKRRSLGQKVAVAGVSLGLAASFSACSPLDVVYSLSYPVREVFDIGTSDTGGAAEPMPLEGEAMPVDPDIDIMGDMEYIPEDNTDIDDECDDGNCDIGSEEENTDNEADDRFVAPIKSFDEKDYELEGGAVYEPEFDI